LVGPAGSCRFIPTPPRPAARIQNGETIVAENPRGSVTGTALLWEGTREDVIFVPNTFGQMQQMSGELRTPLYEPANTLVSDRYYDILSSQQAYKCFACKIRKA
jgi:anaerobic selenocysteine-containing dehydrogenase